MSKPDAPFEYQKALKTVSSYPFLHKYLPIDRLFVRPPASLIVRAVFKTSVTPNQLTVCGFLFSLVAGAAFFLGKPAFFTLGGVLAMISMIFDCADGMLARAKNMTSRYGAFLDIFLDRIADFVVLLGASFGYSKFKGDTRILVFGLVTIALYFLQVSLYYINNVYTRSEKRGEGAEAKSLAVFVIFVFSLLHRPDGFLLGVFLMASAGTVIKLIRFLRKGRDQAVAPAPLP
ncbi:MAG TPA: CDP-alcohol phosphatidyltransferase family protein [Candidatus Latescibacteria bacterium]|nr:CDP-alcohol phosphatidyltransferase family protein [Candidatus Latescibacterota bacterium]